MKKTFCLASNGLKLLSIIFTLLVLGLTIISIIFQSQWYLILLILLCDAFSLLALILCFYNRIVVDSKNNQLLVYTIKKKIIDLNNLRTIEVDTFNNPNQKKLCHIDFKLKDGSVYTIGSYSTIITYKTVLYTRKIVDELLKYLNK